MNTPARRRGLFVGLVSTTTLSMVAIVYVQLSPDGLSTGEAILIGFYGLLLAWISAGFWLFAIGAVTRITKTSPARPSAGLRRRPRTAVVIPIYHEDVANVFDRVRVIYRSLERTGNLDGFEFFVLSDSRDDALGKAEIRAWRDACRDLSASDRLFYRRRLDNRGRKSGNIEEFCRRWGGRYSYMVVLDADSLISGPTLAAMVARMEAEPRLALLQTWPIAVGGQSLFSRLQQFAGSVYGKLFVAGLNWVQMGAGTYWGHNAIIRMRAFAEHCALPPLPGRKPLGGEILSHDFVEAALLIKAGWDVRLAIDLTDSFEEGVPNLIEHARRDRRWCQGNMQHGRLLFARGFHTMSRMTFLIGIMSYLSGPLWMTFLTLAILTFPDQSGGWFWPQRPENPLPGLVVLAVTLTLLIGPKVLGVVLSLVDPKARRSHGGTIPLLVSVLLEILFSALLAPLMAVLHTRFVLSILSGRDSGWGPPQRGSAEVGWLAACRAHCVEIAAGLAFGALSVVAAPDLFWWLLPITVPLVLVVPISVLTSRTSWGHGLRRLHLLLTPNEVDQPLEIRELAAFGRKLSIPEPRGGL